MMHKTSKQVFLNGALAAVIIFVIIVCLHETNQTADQVSKCSLDRPAATNLESNSSGGPEVEVVLGGETGENIGACSEQPSGSSGRDAVNARVSRYPHFVSGIKPDDKESIMTVHSTPSPAQRASLVNQEMDRKLAAADLLPTYAEEMIATWRDQENDELVRNFAVQHLERYARECVVRGTWDPASADAADVRAALEEAVLETGTSVGGAALLALARLSEIDPHVDRARLGARASSLVSDTSVPAANRASAAQVCGLLRVRSAHPALRSLSSDLSTPTPLRLAAQHAAEEIEGR